MPRPRVALALESLHYSDVSSDRVQHDVTFTDANGDGQGAEYNTLQPDDMGRRVLELQLAYVRQAIDTVNDLDNVLYEICNEGKRHTRDWQYEMVRYVKSVEAKLERR